MTFLPSPQPKLVLDLAKAESDINADMRRASITYVRILVEYKLYNTLSLSTLRDTDILAVYF